MVGVDDWQCGEDRRKGQLFSYTDLESDGRADHLLRVIHW
jgi:hypothetical protein